MALATNRLQRFVEALPIRYRLLAIVVTSAALSLLVMVAALTMYRGHGLGSPALLPAAAGAVLAICGLTLLWRTTTRPLDHLAAIVSKALRREDDTLRPPTSGGEIGVLTDGVTSMLGAIERQRGELERGRDTFEQRVGERTAELSAGNAELRQTIATVQAAKLEAETASKAKSDFLANMSHELRTPLNAIIGFSDLMQSEILGPIGNATYRDYAADINFSGKHLLDIINDILDVVRHEAGKMQLKEEAVEIAAVIDEALRLVAPQALQGNVELAWQAPTPALPPLYCDRVRLRQILLNLLSNAVKFTGPGGSVEIRVELGEELQLIVKDSGIGIKAEDISRILTPFGQVASVYSRHQQGAGLGLTLTKALVERHGGRLSLYSAPNIGTTVRLWFPAERVGNAAPRASSA